MGLGMINGGFLRAVHPGLFEASLVLLFVGPEMRSYGAQVWGPTGGQGDARERGAVPLPFHIYSVHFELSSLAPFSSSGLFLLSFHLPSTT